VLCAIAPTPPRLSRLRDRGANHGVPLGSRAQRAPPTDRCKNRRRWKELRRSKYHTMHEDEDTPGVRVETVKHRNRFKQWKSQSYCVEASHMCLTNLAWIPLGGGLASLPPQPTPTTTGRRLRSEWSLLRTRRSTPGTHPPALVVAGYCRTQTRRNPPRSRCRSCGLFLLLRWPACAARGSNTLIHRKHQYTRPLETMKKRRVLSGAPLRPPVTLRTSPSSATRPPPLLGPVCSSSFSLGCDCCCCCCHRRYRCCSKKKKKTARLRYWKHWEDVRNRCCQTRTPVGTHSSPTPRSRKLLRAYPKPTTLSVDKHRAECAGLKNATCAGLRAHFPSGQRGGGAENKRDKRGTRQETGEHLRQQEQYNCVNFKEGSKKGDGMLPKTTHSTLQIVTNSYSNKIS